MNKKISLGVAISAVFIAIAVTFSLTLLFARENFNSQLADLSQKQAVYGKIYELDSAIADKYFAAGEIDYDQLADGVASGYMSGIGDKYAAYYSADDYDEMLSENSGSRTGIGINARIGSDNLSLTVSSVYSGSPANVAGIKAGDEIISVDGKKVSAVGADVTMETLRGEPGTKYKIVVSRKEQQFEMSVEVSKYDVISVWGEQIDNYGLITITEFNSATVSQFESELKRLQDAGVSAIMFDVRNNPGGTLDSVSKILDILLPEGPIVSATYADGTTKTLYNSDESQVDMKMAVIVNGDTASAAELFASALQDYSKAVIVGTQTYGKGVMQDTVRLTDGSAIKYTSAKFNPPYSENFDGVGVTPDVVAEAKSGSDEVYVNDNQIQTAIAELKK